MRKNDNIMMKKILTAFGLLMTVIHAVCAQSEQSVNRPFSEDGKLWFTQVGYIMENSYENQINGDTLINGERWMKVHNSICGWSTGLQDYYAAVRDAGEKVYAVAKGNSRQRLLYDFSLKVGDMIRCGLEGNAFGCLLEKDEKPDTLLGFPFVSYLRVERIDTIESHGYFRRQFTLTLLDSFREPFRGESEGITENVTWIEGIGSAAGPFSPWTPRPPKTSISVNCYDANHHILVEYSDFYDQVKTGMESVSSARERTFHNTNGYDLQGRHLMQAPQKGFYIQEGKKRLAR